MSRMFELVRTSQLSSHQMMSASKGALRVPAAEMVEILVYIAEHNKIFRDTARMTLAAWDETSAKQIVGDPNTPREVLDYWLAPNNIRLALLPVLLENPSASAAKIGELANTAKNEIADVLIASSRVRNSHQLLRDLSANHALSGVQAARLQALMGGTPAAADQEPAQLEAAPPSSEPAHVSPNLSAESTAFLAPAIEMESMSSSSPADAGEEAAVSDAETENAVGAYIAQHAAEITAEGDKPFKAIGGVFDEIAGAEDPAPAIALAAAAGAGAAAAAAAGTAIPASAPSTVATPAKPTVAAKPGVPKKPLVNPENEKRGSTLQKIAALDITGRIQLAMKGTKEERSILIRDGTKIIALAVLESPKISDGEVEKFASQKNVLEAVLRAIPMKRRFAKNYVVLRNLVANPRTPLDVGLGLMKNLLVGDLKNLSGNKEVSETVRKMAMRMFRQKSEAANK